MLQDYERIVNRMIQDGLIKDAPQVAADHVTIYSLPDQGVAYLLAPSAQETSAGKGQVLGVLKVVITLTEALPLDTYVLALDETGEQVRFVGLEQPVRQFPALIRSLPAMPANGPLSLIASRQMCVTQVMQQTCAIVSTPLPVKWRERLSKDIKETLGLDPSQFDVQAAVPDILEPGMWAQCASALKSAAYAECIADTLTAPATRLNQVALPGFGQDARITRLGAMDVLRDLQQVAYLNPDLTEPAPILPMSPYLSYSIVLPNDRVLATVPEGSVTVSRAGLSRRPESIPEFYIVGLNNTPFGPPSDGERPQAAILDLVIGPFCIGRAEAAACTPG